MSTEMMHEVAARNVAVSERPVPPIIREDIRWHRPEILRSEGLEIGLADSLSSEPTRLWLALIPRNHKV